MAGALVGGAFLSGFIDVVLNRLLTMDTVNQALGNKLGADLVERLKISLLAAEAVLDDAEYKQQRDKRVRNWLDSLRDAVYDADDFLDAVLTKEATQKEVRSALPSFLLNRHRKMVDNMERVVSRIESLVKRKDTLELQKSTKDNNLSSSSSSWRETTCLMEGNIYGREKDQQALIKIINDNRESQLTVIPIVGMGGVGKTTLAKWAYSVAEGFDLKAWVSISETFDVAEITKKTIEEITKNSCILGSLNLLQNKLQEILSGKKFFIVLDNVWSDDADKWMQFITPFHRGAKGSSILLTTRNQEVASVVQTCPSCTLSGLSEESCWLLFAANACFPESNGNPTLEEIGRKIVNKCKGLPLAVETLGRLLRGKNDAEEWNAVLRSDIWESSYSRETTCLMEGKIYGREKDQQALIKTINDNRESQLSVIPIVGMGGVGKTTLAKWAYSVAEGFDLKAWVCISETFDVAETTKKTIEEITKNSCTLGSLNLLQNKLQEILSGKKFFFVLDDVWSDDADKWKQFITPFQCGAKGSTILLTTRIQSVASVVQTCPSCTLSRLSEESCWLLFAANACFPESNGNPALENIGREIVNKCNGLPLAVETLGSSLRGKDDAEEWNAVLRSGIWESSEGSGILPALLISYFQLPPYLKRCFVYCSLFPKDHYFEKNELILLWMAEDLLRRPKRGESLEEVGSECFEELASRLFFEKLQDNDKYFVMPDLLHDLAIFLAGEFYCGFGNEEMIRIQLLRHLCANLHHCGSKQLNLISEVESLRTFLLFRDLSSINYNIEAATCEILSKHKYLRVLSFTKINVAPNLIGELIHMRYLDLSWTIIKTLPESLCNMYNLQTLKLYGCWELTMLPSGLHNLVNLRHLDIRETSLEEMPRKMSNLNQLHVLSSFVVGKHEENGIQELGGMVNLHGPLEIKKLENIVDVNEAQSAKMKDKKHIDELCLEWSSGDDLVSSTETQRDMLDNLQPHNGLKELKIKGYKGTIFPNWVWHCSYQNMTSVSLESCKNCYMLPSLGQLPSLKSLSIEGFDQLRSIGEEFYKNEGDHHSLFAAFPSLESLEFDNMPCWEVWHKSESETFPQLRKIQVRNCPMLKEVMSIVSSLSDVSKVRKLHIYDNLMGLGIEDMFLDGDTLSIRGCESVKESAMISINHLSCLQEINISKCSSMTSLSLDVFPNLKNLKIKGCRNLESVSMSEAPHAALQDVTIIECDKLVSFAGEGLAAPNLTHLQVTYCDNLKAFAGEGLAAPNLTHLSLIECSKLEALLPDMNSLLPSLQSLEIYGCPSIRSLPEGGLPPNLKSLAWGICEQQMWDLSRMANFHALTHLSIIGLGCKNIKSYPEVGSLPRLPSLTTLDIWCFDNLETLECNELLRLTSLQQLHISFCKRLENMAGEKLPPSLLLLQIEQCPLLGEHCKNKHQLIWPKISHISTIKVV